MSSGAERVTSLLGLLNCNSNSKTTEPVSNPSAHASPANAPAPAATSATAVDLSKLLAAAAISTPEQTRQPNKQLASSANSATASGERCHFFSAVCKSFVNIRFAMCVLYIYLSSCVIYAEYNLKTGDSVEVSLVFHVECTTYA